MCKGFYFEVGSMWIYLDIILCQVLRYSSAGEKEDWEQEEKGGDAIPEHSLARADAAPRSYSRLQ